MSGREISLGLVLTLAMAAPLAGQVARTPDACDSRAAVGLIGITGIECNCTIGSPDADKWSFRTEPRITRLDSRTRARGVLRIGDIITHVDGKLITTREGARAIASVKPGQAVVLTVRRNNEVLKYAVTAEATCPDGAEVGVHAPRARASGAITPPPQAAVAPRLLRNRGSFGFGLMCSGNCEIRAESSGALRFSEPPEVYSVERGSGADKAGIRRGDVVTHVNGKAITSKEGGQILGTAKPGQEVRFTISRGGSSRTVTLTAEPAAAVLGADLTKSSEALVRAQQSLRELQQEQQRQLQQIQQELRQSRALEESRIRELQREFSRQEQEHRRKLAELSTELARADSRLRKALTDSARTSCAVVTPRPGSRTLRYTGVIADTEIEVHGPNPVWVDEKGDEVTITAGQTTIKVKRARQ